MNVNGLRDVLQNYKKIHIMLKNIWIDVIMLQ